MDSALMMGMQPVNHKRLFECDSCGYEVSGYSKKDLEGEGWMFHKLNVTRDFTMCDDCVARYEDRWAATRTG